MPSLIRFIIFVGIIVGLVYGAMFGLVAYVEPKKRPMSARVPTDQINPVRVQAPAPVQDDDENSENNSAN